jgi:hypothetical protein
MAEKRTKKENTEAVEDAVAEDVARYEDERRRRWRWTIAIVVALLVIKIICCVFLWFQLRSVRDAVGRIAFDEQTGAKLEEALAQIEGLESRLARQGGTGTCPEGGDTTPKSGQGVTQVASLLEDVQIVECRVEFVFQSSTPSFTIEYRAGPSFVQDQSGNPFTVQGSAFLVIEMEPASRFDLTTGTQVYTGPDVVTSSGGVVQEAHLKQDFEEQLDWVIGLDKQRDFSVQVGSSPPRIVVTLHG